jgi:hypothetical protein
VTLSASAGTTTVTSATLSGTQAAGGSGGAAGGSGGSVEGNGTVSAAQVAEICATAGSNGSCSSTRFVALRDGTVTQPAAQIQLSEKELLW